METHGKKEEEILKQIEESKAAEEQAQEQIRHWKKEENKNKVERLQREAELEGIRYPTPERDPNSEGNH
ncbi:hypothetical protein [Larkinella soli]|uniref:hypothetical protein n=1 Tax=Larkinella soli TaxID=1770527 RepID=UPI000FFB0ED2|nr:hypothetical protein [Larkinella soli]